MNWSDFLKAFFSFFCQIHLDIFFSCDKTIFLFCINFIWLDWLTLAPKWHPQPEKKQTNFYNTSAENNSNNNYNIKDGVHANPSITSLSLFFSNDFEDEHKKNFDNIYVTEISFTDYSMLLFFLKVSTVEFPTNWTTDIQTTINWRPVSSSTLHKIQFSYRMRILLLSWGEGGKDKFVFTV